MEKEQSKPPAMTFEARPLLTDGLWGHKEDRVHICVDSALPREIAEVTIWHEIVHVLRDAGGHPWRELDEVGLAREEAYVDLLATKLAIAVPEIVELVGLGKAFPHPPTIVC